MGGGAGRGKWGTTDVAEEGMGMSEASTEKSDGACQVGGTGRHSSEGTTGH